MAGRKDILLGKIRDGQPMTLREQLALTAFLSIPAILAQLSSVLMQYIDTAMVGHLGANQSASIGLISTSTWIFMGFCSATSSGFSVQIAHLVGSNDFARAREVVRQGLTSVLLFSVVLALIGVAIAPSLPCWLGGNPDITADASAYFLIFAACLPLQQLVFSCGGMLQASGNMKVPSMLNINRCIMDVAFNYLFIYGLGLGVVGAAIGTGVSVLITAGLMLWFLTVRSPELNLRQDRGSFLPQRATLRNALGIASPMWLQNLIMRGAYVMNTIIVAPLGTVSIAANAFAITAESFCYMPGYGLEEAATTLVGQSLGAKRRELARRFATITTASGAAIMTLLGIVMYAFAPALMGLLSSDPDVVALGAKVLRIEAFAETMFAVSIVAYGAFVGAGDTLVPSALNLASMWVVRIGLALVLTPRLGLQGYWIAMCIELNIRGLLFLMRIRGDRWMKSRLIKV